MSAVRTITTEELMDRLERGGAFQFWNVLTDQYFDGTFIPGSLRVPVDRIGAEVTRLSLPKSAEIIVYCAGPTCPSSKDAATKLSHLGFTNVKAYEGGLAEWKAAGYETTRLRSVTAA